MGTSPDCNANGIPDECEIDVNSTAPGGPFFCMQDCDPDCNSNGVPDECDITQGTSQDLNENGVPDECEDESPPTEFNWVDMPAPAQPPNDLSAITMKVTATDPCGVEYRFDVQGSTGTWQTDPTFTDSGLPPNSPRFYQVKARDRSIQQNEATTTLEAAAATAIETPAGISFGAITDCAIEINALDTFTDLDENLSGLYFEVTMLTGTPVGGSQANTSVQTPTITATGLTAGTTYRFRVKARNYYSENQTPWCPPSGYEEQATTAIDVEPPTPDPMTWNADPDGAPIPISISAIRMTATEATDACGVEYYFSASGIGSHSSGWQAGRTYMDTGLQINRTYCYKVKARDSAHNETDYSSVVGRATFFETPTDLQFGPITDTSVEVTAPGMFTRLTAYLSGLYFEVLDPSDTPVGGSEANAWVKTQTITATGLTAGTIYRFRVKARNYYKLNETPWYPGSGFIEQATTGP